MGDFLFSDIAPIHGLAKVQTVLSWQSTREPVPKKSSSNLFSKHSGGLRLRSAYSSCEVNQRKRCSQAIGPRQQFVDLAVQWPLRSW